MNGYVRISKCRAWLHGLGVRGFYTRYRLDELDLLAMTLEALA